MSKIKSAEEFFTQEWGTGFIRATLSEKNGLLDMSMEDIYSTMQKHTDYVLKAKLESITDELINSQAGFYSVFGVEQSAFTEGAKWLKQKLLKDE